MTEPSEDGSARALYVSAFIPNASAPHAGGQVAFQNLANLRRRGLDALVLICSTEREAATSVAGEVRFHQTWRKLLWSWAAQVLTGPWRGILGWPYLHTRANGAFERRLRSELELRRYDVVFADFTQVLYPLWRILRKKKTRPRVLFCAHDIYAQKLGRERGAARMLLSGATVRMERFLLEWVDEVITLSDKDRQLVQAAVPGAKVTVKAFEPPAWVADVRREPVRGELLFFANFDRPENREALEWLVRAALPGIADQVPQLRLVLLGGGSDVVPISRSACQITRLGYRENPAQAFSTCQFVVAPLALGAGIKFKVLEALACGVPVVGTAVALEGVPRCALTTEASREEFSAALLALLRAS